MTQYFVTIKTTNENAPTSILELDGSHPMRWRNSCLNSDWNYSCIEKCYFRSPPFEQVFHDGKWVYVSNMSQKVVKMCKLFSLKIEGEMSADLANKLNGDWLLDLLQRAIAVETSNKVVVTVGPG
jgi:hypothetical protein